MKSNYDKCITVNGDLEGEPLRAIILEDRHKKIFYKVQPMTMDEVLDLLNDKQLVLRTRTLSDESIVRA